MKKGQKLYKIRVIIGQRLPKKIDEDEQRFVSNFIFRILKEAKLDVKEVWVANAEVVKSPSKLEIIEQDGRSGTEDKKWSGEK